jgi:hypothetical protein
VNRGAHLRGVVVVNDDEFDGVIPSAAGTGRKEGAELLG